MASYRISSSETGAFGRIISKESSNITTGAMKAVSGGTRGANNYARILAQGLYKGLSDKGQLTKIHEDVAAAMRQAVKSSFEQTVHSKPGQYREGQNRISGGALKRAISNPSMAIGTAEGIDFVDEGRLDKEAIHWRRLNFGALGTKVPGRNPADLVVPFRFDDITLFSLAFKDTSRPAFSLPPGMFKSSTGERRDFDPERRGMDQFYPGSLYPLMGREHWTKTSGIKPREFLNAGLERMAKNLPVAYENMIDGWLADAEKAMQVEPSFNVRAGWGRNKLGQWSQSGP